MPYHPLVYDYIKNTPKYSVVKDVESYINKYAIENGIDVIGSYDPTYLKLESENFYDGMHLAPEGVDKVFNGN